MKIHKLSHIDQSRLEQLCELLQDAVASGASIGFLSPMTKAKATAYWQQVDQSLTRNRILWVAEAEGQIAGAVQLALSDKENASHRAEIQKLIVRQDHRGKSLSSKLMDAAEQAAMSKGRSLLVLDTQAGSKAESIYRHFGWTCVGQIPQYAAMPNGALEATSYYYKQLKV